MLFLSILAPFTLTNDIGVKFLSTYVDAMIIFLGNYNSRFLMKLLKAYNTTNMVLKVQCILESNIFLYWCMYV